MAPISRSHFLPKVVSLSELILLIHTSFCQQKLWRIQAKSHMGNSECEPCMCHTQGFWEQCFLNILYPGRVVF